MGITLASTVKALTEAHKRCQTLDGVIEEYSVSVSKGTLSRMLRSESVSYAAERAVRTALAVDKPRPPCYRPRLSLELRDRIEAKRGALSVEEYIDQALLRSDLLEECNA